MRPSSWHPPEAGAELVCGTSLKAALDRDWDQHLQKNEALDLVLQVLSSVQTWVETLADQEEKTVAQGMKIAERVQEQDVEVNEQGKACLIKGVAKDRRISVEDSEMRHGRKSRSVLVDGYKRHMLHDLDTGLIRVVGLTPANVPEASVTEAISEDLDQQKELLRWAVLDCFLLDMDSSFNRFKDFELLQEDAYCRQTCRRGKMRRDIRDRLVHSDGSPHESVTIKFFH